MKLMDFAASWRNGPRGELFGRFQRPGWDVWGNEPEKFNAAALAAGADLGIASAK